ncbi:MAG: radical SAM protein [Candidatus Alcyoniella australis]|nr:radical SAM protein [Candidatus Alcyoniella australis]
MILLVVPRMFSLTRTPPLGLGYIAGALSAVGREVRLLDLNFSEDQRVLAATLADPALEWVGLNNNVQNQSGAHSAAQMIRELRPDAPIVLGGSWPTLFAERALEQTGAFAAVLGESEETVVELAQALADGGDLEQVDGIVYRSAQGEPRRTAPRAAPDLAKLPWPRWDLIPPKRYSAIPWQAIRRGKVVTTLITGRGCPYNCTYCAASVVTGKRWRPRPMPDVLDELQMLIDKHGVDELHILDDNFIGSRDHAQAFCEGLIERKMQLHWKTPNGVRADAIDAELLALMRRSGCYMLGFGIESGDPAVLRRNKKPLDLDAARRAVELTREAGILTFGYFILGLPGDNEQTIERTVRWALDAPLDLANFSYCIPYPGCELFEGLDEQTKRNVISRSYHFAPVQLSDVPLPRLRTLFRRAWLRFFLRFGPLTTVARFIRPVTAYALLRISFYYFGSKVRLPRTDDKN